MEIKFLTRILGIPTSQKLFFIQHLNVMLRAGIPLSKSLKTLAIQATNPNLKEVLTNIGIQVEKGDALSKSIKEYPKVFNDLFISMVQAGELTGNMEEILNRLYIQMKKDYELRSKVRGAMTYPVIVVMAMIGVAIGMITFVIPRITAVFKEVNLDLPLPTRLLIFISDMVVEHGLLTAVFCITAIVTFVKYIRSKKGKQVWHYVLLKMPIISGAVKKVNLARFARTLSSLLKTSIPISRTLATTGQTLGNHWYKQSIIDASEKIEKGILLSEVLAKSPNLFPPVIIQMIQVGEQTGSIDSIMEDIAGFYEEEVSNMLNNISTLIEPILILLLGIGVAFIAVSVLLPLYSLSQSI